MIRALSTLSVLLVAACTGDKPIAQPEDPPPAMMNEVEKKAPPAATPKAADHAHGDGDALGAYKPLDANGKRVFFVEPADGASVTSPVKLVFGAEGVEVVPAGTLKPDSGHHHVLVDAEPTEEGVAVPKDATHIHYGKGQTEAELELAPGKHTLTMQFADFAHRSYGADFTASITIEVTE